MWLPEAAVNDDVLAVLAEEGVGFTILAPARRPRSAPRRPAPGRTPGRPTRTTRPTARHAAARTAGATRTGPTAWASTSSSTTAACPTTVPSSCGHCRVEALVDRVVDAAGPEGGLVAVATDGETFGHHHHWGDRLLAYALAVEAPAGASR